MPRKLGWTAVFAIKSMELYKKIWLGQALSGFEATLEGRLKPAIREWAQGVWRALGWRVGLKDGAHASAGKAPGFTDRLTPDLPQNFEGVWKDTRGSQGQLLGLRFMRVSANPSGLETFGTACKTVAPLHFRVVPGLLFVSIEWRVVNRYVAGRPKQL